MGDARQIMYTVDNCLDQGIMAGAKKSEVRSQKPEDRGRNLRQKNREQKYGNHRRAAVGA